MLLNITLFAPSQVYMSQHAYMHTSNMQTKLEFRHLTSQKLCQEHCTSIEHSSKWKLCIAKKSCRKECVRSLAQSSWGVWNIVNPSAYWIMLVWTTFLSQCASFNEKSTTTDWQQSTCSWRAHSGRDSERSCQHPDWGQVHLLMHTQLWVPAKS